MKNNNRKSCFECAACSFSCPNDSIDEFGNRIDSGFERVLCSDCPYNSGECIDCLFVSSPDCLDSMHHLSIDRG